jgi:hypothetical protein
MATRSKPAVMGSSHTLRLEKLTLLDFGRLCLWLVRREGYSGAEYLGEAGSERGCDVVARKDGGRVVFQCSQTKHLALLSGKILALLSLNTNGIAAQWCYSWIPCHRCSSGRPTARLAVGRRPSWGAMPYQYTFSKTLS